MAEPEPPSVIGCAKVPRTGSTGSRSAATLPQADVLLDLLDARRWALLSAAGIADGAIAASTFTLRLVSATARELRTACFLTGGTEAEVEACA